MMMQKLERKVFETSRVLEFFSEKELTMQMGHGSKWWPIAIVKELIDNALDACEIAGIPPAVEVEQTEEGISVADNGPGLPEPVIKRSLDYLVRVSDKSHYVSPTRGQLGNALKTVYAAPFVMDGELGRVEIHTGEVVYEVEISLDRIAQVPVLELNQRNSAPKVHGTKITVNLPDSTSLIDDPEGSILYNGQTMIGTAPPPSIRDLLVNYAMFNPHASFRFRDLQISPTDTEWGKWAPNNPTSPHWYTSEQLRDLIAGYLVAECDIDRPMTVREFVAEFRGLARTAKQKAVCEDSALHGKSLTDLVQDGDIRSGLVERLLSAMKEHSKPVRPALLGSLGEEHLTGRMVEFLNVAPESIRYKRIVNSDDLPYVLEMGFGVYDEEHEEGSRTIITGLNWAPTLGLAVREFRYMLQEMRVDRHDPVAIVLHIARPRFEFVDRGKGQLDV